MKAYYFLSYALRPIYWGSVGTLIYVWLRSSAHASHALAGAERERMEVEPRLVASELDAAEAEVDPSFVDAR